jgi:hypothetical protein
MQELDNMSQGSGKLPFGTAAGSVASIPQAFFNMAMEVDMCSLSKCTSCGALLYDEEIMAGWSADDSNLNTTCQFCNTKLVPTLQIQVKDFRQSSRPLLLTPSQSSESMQSIQSMPNFQLNPTASATDVRPPIPPNASAPVLPALGNRLAATSKPEDDPLPEGNTPAEEAVNGEPTCDVLVNGSVNNEADTEILQSDTQLQSPVCETEVKAGNLIQLSPAHSNHVTNYETTGEDHDKDSEIPVEEQVDQPNNVEETIQENGEVPKSDVPIVVGTVPGSPQRRRCTSECNTSATPASPPSLDATPSVQNGKSHADGDRTSQSSAVEDDSTSITSENKLEVPDGCPCHKRPVVSDPFTVPYLSPLVLRKEVENVLEQEGDLCLSKAQFVDEHPIIFWNLVWYFKRLDVPSHLTGFILTANSTNKEMPPPKSWLTADCRHVLIRPLWDNQRLHEELGHPMYTIWNQARHESATLNALITESQTISRSVMQHIVSDIMCSDVVSPIKLIQTERRKQKYGKGRFHSMYRDILFLSFAALGHENIDHDAFDREYREAYSQLPHRELTRMKPYDRPPKLSVICCRRLFGELELRVPGSS